MARVCPLQAYLSSRGETHSQFRNSAWSLDACTSRGPLRLDPTDRAGPRGEEGLLNAQELAEPTSAALDGRGLRAFSAGKEGLGLPVSLGSP